MTDVFSPAKRSEVMALIRSSGNRLTELAMIRVFRESGITGWRRGQVLTLAHEGKSRRIRPDFLFRRERVAVFVDGEFWHGHPTRCRIPTTRREWWTAKIDGNKRRDRLQNRLLRAAGWKVTRIWQFEIGIHRDIRKLRLAGLF